jgi:heat shock protein HslJ
LIHTRKVLSGILAGALLVTALPAIVAAQDELEVSPEGVVWSLTAAGTQEVPADVPANLYMEEGEVNGNLGCNSFHGTYELDGSSLTFDPNMAATLAICDGDGQAVEDAYRPALAEVATWSIDGNVMSLADEAGTVVLTFEEEIIDVTETDIAALISELVHLDGRINKTRKDVRQLNIPKIQNHTDANTVDVAALSKRVENLNVPALRDRVKANEEVLNAQGNTVTRLRARVTDLEDRVKALEQAN